MSLLAPPVAIVRAIRPQLVDLVEGASRVYERVPFQATSWWRSVERNRQVGDV